MLTTRFYDDIELDNPRQYGDHLLSEEAIVEFATAWDPQPFHIDHQAAATSVFGELVACAAHLFAINSLLVTQDPHPAALLAGLSGTGLRLNSPGRIGDRLSMRLTYLTKRVSASRPQAGVVNQRTELVDRNGRLVLFQEGAVLIARRP